MWQSFECCGKKIIGKPCEGEPHARFEVAGDGNGLPRPRLTLPVTVIASEPCSSELERPYPSLKGKEKAYKLGKIVFLMEGSRRGT